MKDIESYYESYSKDVIPKDAGPTQLSETRAAFYCGAIAMFEMMNEVGDLHDMGEAMKALDEINAEVKAFIEEMKMNVAMQTVDKIFKDVMT